MTPLLPAGPTYPLRFLSTPFILSILFLSLVPQLAALHSPTLLYGSELCCSVVSLVSKLFSMEHESVQTESVAGGG